MEIQPQATIQPLTESLEFAEPPEPVSLADQPPRQKLNLKYLEPQDTDPAVSPSPWAGIGENDSSSGDVRWLSMAFFRHSIGDRELRHPRIQAGLTFIGFGALGLAFLLLFTHALHPEFDWVAVVSEYWYPYMGFASLGVAGSIVLARESLRP